MLRDYLKSKTTVRFSRNNIYIRDNGQCQYCGTYIERKDATLDHVTPIARGGKTTWENCTTSCSPCNANKSDKSGWKPKLKPYKPDYYDLVNKRKKFPFQVRNQDWLQFIV